MRTASGALIALLNSQSQFAVADCLTIVQANGTVTRLTSADVDVTAVSQVDGLSHVFSSSGPTFTRTRTKLVIGLEIDTMTLTLAVDPTRDLLGGIPWSSAARLGAFDEARIVVERAFMASWGDTSAGTIIAFSGRAGEIDPTRTTIVIQVNSDLERLQAPMPRNSYQPGCVHALFDTGCGLNPASFAVTGSVQAGSTDRLILTTLGNATGYFDLGTLVFSSGALSGQKVTIRTFISGTSLAPAAPLAGVPAPGDTFTVYPGCDKLQATCSGKFANLARFRGYPYVPAPESAK